MAVNVQMCPASEGASSEVGIDDIRNHQSESDVVGKPLKE
jgi:hypothetical protein